MTPTPESIAQKVANCGYKGECCSSPCGQCVAARLAFAEGEKSGKAKAFWECAEKANKGGLWFQISEWAESKALEEKS
jgi:hypothetical protein